MALRVFYCCYASDSRVPSANPVAVEKDDVVVLVNRVLQSPHDFFGIVDAEQRVLQLYYEVSGRIWVEIPDAKEQGAYGKHITFDELSALLLSLPECLTVDSVPGLVFRSW